MLNKTGRLVTGLFVASVVFPMLIPATGRQATSETEENKNSSRKTTAVKLESDKFISLLLKVDHDLTLIQDLLLENRVLALKSSDGLTSDRERFDLNYQFQKNIETIAFITTNSKLSGITLLDNTGYGKIRSVKLSISSGTNQIEFDLPVIESEAFGIASWGSKNFLWNLTYMESGNRALGLVDQVIGVIITERMRVLATLKQVRVAEKILGTSGK